MFLAGDADFCYVPIMHLPELVPNYEEGMAWEDEEYPPGIECIPGLPTLSESNFFFTFDVSTLSTYIGDPPHDQIHEFGVPYDFFNDLNLRKAFAYSFNWSQYIADVCLYEASQPATPHVQGLAYADYIWDVMDPDLDPADTLGPAPYSQPPMPNGTILPPVPMHYINLTKAEYYFTLAWGGDVWANGFTFDVLYNTGNEARRTAALMLEEVVEGLNSKFHMTVIGVDWPTYLGAMVGQKLPLFLIGWLADYPDPHNFFHPYMHSTGTFSHWQAYSNPTVDALIEAGIAETDDNKRIAIYWQLGNIYFEDVVSVPIVQATGRHWERDSVEGWYSNAIYPGPYYYHYWKGYVGDVKRDYTVDIFDLVKVAGAYGTSLGDPKWDPPSDVNGDGTVDIFDLVLVAGQYG